MLRTLWAHGGALVALRLTQSSTLVPQHQAGLPQQGSNPVKASRYVEKEERVYITTPPQYLAPVPPAAWGWLVGGYTPLQKGLGTSQKPHP